MFFILYAADNPNSLHIRKANRDAHLVWLKSDETVVVKIAGPWLDGDGEMRGSLLIVEADTRKIVEAWVSLDPYGRAGLTESIDIKPYNWVIGKP